MAGAALVDLGGHHPDVARELFGDLGQRQQTGRMDAVVVGDEDTRLGEVGGLHFLATPAAIVSTPRI